jgi:DNA polymerase/3'-5' exonuclease PolX
MSKTGAPMVLAEALSLASEFIALVGAQCDKISVAGSARRNKPMVNDIEIVAQPKGGALWGLLDDMVKKGIITKALYGEVSPTHRWNGQKYRGLVYKGRRIEIFCGDEHNYGYQLWLRTGPDNQTDRANTFVVTQIKYKSPISLVEGRVMMGSRQVSVPDEHVWFGLLGLDFIHPSKRTESAYKALANPNHQWGDPVPHFISDLQPKLF